MSAKGPASLSLAASYSGAAGYDTANPRAEPKVIDKADAMGREESLIRSTFEKLIFVKKICLAMQGPGFDP